MAPTTASSLSLPPEIAQAIRDNGRQEGRWIRCKCPYCDPEGRGRRNVAVGERGWICHANACQKIRRDDRVRVELKLRRQSETSRDEARRRLKAMQLIEESGAIRPGCPVDLYLRGRCLRPLTDQWPADLRRHNRLWHPDTRKEYVGMVAIVRDVTGTAVAVHRTYLMPDGRRANDPTVNDAWRVEDAKRSLAPLIGGHAVRLGFDPEADTIGVAEGIESTLALAMKLQLPCWSGLSSNGVAAMKIPPEIRRVVIGPDIGDKKGAGMKAAIDLRQRLLDDVRSGKRTKTAVEFLRPLIREPRGDWADWAKQTFAATAHP